MLINKPIFPSLSRAVSAFSKMTLSPYGKGAGDSIEEIVKERTYELDEYWYKAGGTLLPVAVMWGEGDYFYIYPKESGEHVIIDGVHEDDPAHQKAFSDELLRMLKRCMLAGYVPHALLRAMHDYGRGGPDGDFENIFGDAIDHVEDILECFGV